MSGWALSIIAIEHCPSDRARTRIPFSCPTRKLLSMFWIPLINVYFLFGLVLSARLPSASVRTIDTAASNGLAFPANGSATAINVTAWGKTNIICLTGREPGPAKYERCENAAQHIPHSGRRFDFANRFDEGRDPNAIVMPINFFNSRCLVKRSIHVKP